MSHPPIHYSYGFCCCHIMRVANRIGSIVVWESSALKYHPDKVVFWATVIYSTSHYELFTQVAFALEIFLCYPRNLLQSPELQKSLNISKVTEIIFSLFVCYFLLILFSCMTFIPSCSCWILILKYNVFL